MTPSICTDMCCIPSTEVVHLLYDCISTSSKVQRTQDNCLVERASSKYRRCSACLFMWVRTFWWTLIEKKLSE